MRRIGNLLTFSALFAGLAAAESWTGSLVDAACHDRQQASKEPAKAGDVCAATSQTTAFALQAGGKVYKFDSAGNQKAMAAFKSRADRTAPGQALTNISAKVEGSEASGLITVEKVELQ